MAFLNSFMTVLLGPRPPLAVPAAVVVIVDGIAAAMARSAVAVGSVVWLIVGSLLGLVPPGDRARRVPVARTLQTKGLRWRPRPRARRFVPWRGRRRTRQDAVAARPPGGSRGRPGEGARGTCLA